MRLPAKRICSCSGNDVPSHSEREAVAPEPLLSSSTAQRPHQVSASGSFLPWTIDSPVLQLELILNIHFQSLTSSRESFSFPLRFTLPGRGLISLPSFLPINPLTPLRRLLPYSWKYRDFHNYRRFRCSVWTPDLEECRYIYLIVTCESGPVLIGTLYNT